MLKICAAYMYFVFVVGIVVIVTGSTIRIDLCKTKMKKKNFTREEYRLRGHSCWIKKQASSLLPQPNLSLAVVTSIHSLKPRIYNVHPLPQTCTMDALLQCITV